jgi:CheY-like chemotaxis protein/anti-sigma regulatory factor (Ser/Thr protein kinase)
MNRTALIVEDDPDIGFLLSEYVRARFFEPTWLDTGRPAVQWARANQPDLILLDLMLPDRDGYDICQELKLDRQTNLIPIIMATARVQPEDRKHGLEVGANYYLTKPFTEEQVDEAIRHVLAWRDELEHHGTEGEIHFHLPSDTRYLEELNHLLASLFFFTGLDELQVRKLTIAVGELGMNAIEWGHQKQIDRIVTVTYRIDQDKLTIVVRDTGPGFDPKHLPHAAHPEDPAAHLLVREMLGLRDGGFGILMARGLVDDLRYNDTGNEARLVKYLPQQVSRARSKFESSTSKVNQP